MLQATLDYFSGVTHFESLAHCEEFLDDVARLISPKDEIFIEAKPTLLGENFNLRIGSIFKLYGGIRTENDKVKLALQIPGTFCRKLGNQREAVEMLANTLKPTRVDLALDDYQRRVTQNAVNHLGQKGHYKGVEHYELISSKGSQDDQPVSTCYFGASLKAMRFYNAEAVHGFPADRWELQARAHYAEEATFNLLQCTDSEELFPQAIGAMVTGAIDFIKPGINSYYDRRYAFWQNLRDEIGTIKLNPPSQEHSLEKVQRWIERQWQPTLRVLYEGLGRQNFFNYLEREALNRDLDKLTEYQLAWISYLKRSKETL
jgi:hypothetical protein